MKHCRWLLCAYILLLCSCTPYTTHRDGWLDGWTGGFMDSRVDANTYIVKFQGYFYTPQRTAQTFALYHCATLTTRAGFDYFVVTNASELMPDNSANNYYQMAPQAANSHSSSVVIKMYNGAIPAGMPNAYNAEEVIAHLGPTT